MHDFCEATQCCVCQFLLLFAPFYRMNFKRVKCLAIYACVCVCVCDWERLKLQVNRTLHTYWGSQSAGTICDIAYWCPPKHSFSFSNLNSYLLIFWLRNRCSNCFLWITRALNPMDGCGIVRSTLSVADYPLEKWWDLVTMYSRVNNLIRSRSVSYSHITFFLLFQIFVDISLITWLFNYYLLVSFKCPNLWPHW